MGEMIKVAEKRQVRPGKPFAVDVQGKKVVLYNVQGEYFASDQRCPHMGASLDDGVVENLEIICPLHMWSFDLRTGVCTSNSLAPQNVKVYRVKVEGTALWIEL